MRKGRTQGTRLSCLIQHSRVKYRWPPDLLGGSPCGTWCETPGARSGGWGAGFFPSQWVNSMLSLSYHNCFSVLPMCSLNETVEPSTDVQNSISENLTVIPMEITRNRRSKCVSGRQFHLPQTEGWAWNHWYRGSEVRQLFCGQWSHQRVHRPPLRQEQPAPHSEALRTHSGLQHWRNSERGWFYHWSGGSYLEIPESFGANTICCHC